MAEFWLDFLFPSWWEVEITVSAALFVVSVGYLISGAGGGQGDRRRGGDGPAVAKEPLVLETEDRNKVRYVIMSASWNLFRSSLFEYCLEEEECSGIF